MDGYRAKILIVDDQDSNLVAMKKILEREAYQAICAHSVSVALEYCKNENFDLIISDLRMPALSGVDLLRELRKANKLAPVILLTAYGTVNDAVEAMRLGALDFLAKPIKSEVLLKAVQDNLNRGLGVSPNFTMIGQSAQISELKRTIKMLARTTATVLIEGESGTGKEVVAKMVHAESGRKGKLITLNCGAIPENLIESELFGYEKGAFTGADSPRQGLLAAADDGTLFLDEVGEMPLHLQVKLLRVLQDSTYTPLGSTNAKTVNVRVVAATNADLKAKVRLGKFREDLYYRLNVISLTLPSLRERKEDITLLASYFFEFAKTIHGRPELSLGANFLRELSHYSWPGNVRELKNSLERAVVTARGPVLLLSDLKISFEGIEPVSVSAPAATDRSPRGEMHFTVGMTLEEIELEVIRRTLEYTQGDKAKAAKILGINQRTIYRKQIDRSVN